MFLIYIVIMIAAIFIIGLYALFFAFDLLGANPYLIEMLFIKFDFNL